MTWWNAAMIAVQVGGTLLQRDDNKDAARDATPDATRVINDTIAGYNNTRQGRGGAAQNDALALMGLQDLALTGGQAQNKAMADLDAWYQADLRTQRQQATKNGKLDPNFQPIDKATWLQQKAQDHPENPVIQEYMRSTSAIGQLEGIAPQIDAINAGSNRALREADLADAEANAGRFGAIDRAANPELYGQLDNLQRPDATAQNWADQQMRGSLEGGPAQLNQDIASLGTPSAMGAQAQNLAMQGGQLANAPRAQFDTKAIGAPSYDFIQADTLARRQPQRAADQASNFQGTIDQLGQARNARAQTSQSNLLRQAEQSAGARLASGGALGADETRNIQQDVRGAFADRGMGRSNASIFSEAMNLEGARRQRQLENESQATQIAQAGASERMANADRGTNVSLSNADRDISRLGLQGSLIGAQANTALSQAQQNEQFRQGQIQNLMGMDQAQRDRMLQQYSAEMGLYDRNTDLNFRMADQANQEQQRQIGNLANLDQQQLQRGLASLGMEQSQFGLNQGALQNYQQQLAQQQAQAVSRGQLNFSNDLAQLGAWQNMR